MTDAPPQTPTLAPERLRRLMNAVSGSVRRIVTDPERPTTIWQIAGELVSAHDDYRAEALIPELDRPGDKRPAWQWLAQVVGLYDVEAVAATRSQVVDGRLLVLGFARLDDEFEAALRRTRTRRRLERDLGFAAESVLRPWARATAPTQMLPIWRFEYGSFLTSAAVDRRGRLLAAGAGDGSVVLWDLATGRPDPAVLGSLPDARAVAFSPDGGMLVAGGTGSEVKRWDLRTRAPLPSLAAPGGGVQRLEFAPDGSAILLVPWASRSRLHEFSTGSGRDFELRGRVTAASFAPDGNTIAVGTDEGTVRLVATLDGASVRRTIDVGGLVHRCAFSPDGRLLAIAARESGPLLVALDEVEPIEALNLVGGVTTDCAFSPDGSLLAFAFPDGPVVLWDVSLGLERMALGAGCTECAFSADGRLVVGSSPRGIRVWEVATGAGRGDFEAYPAQVAVAAGLVAQAGSDEAEERGVAQVWEEVAQSQLPAVAADTLSDEDLVGVQPDADALADVIAATGTEPPLSIGLFGDWGSGKSFLIRLIQNQVRRLAVRSRQASGQSSYCAYIRNVEFNAWQYAEGNLWASLVTHLFDELAKPEPAAGVTSEQRAREQLARLEASLAASSGVHDRLERARAHAERAAVLRALRRWTAWLVGVDADTTLETAGDVRSLAALLVRTGRARRALAAVLVLIAVIVAVVLTVAGADWLIAAAGAVATAATVAGGWVTAVAARVRALVPRAGESLRVGDVQRPDLDAELEAARAAAAELERELSDLAAGRRVARFAGERSQSADYRSQLGMVSRIHDDFARMSDLLAQQRQQSGDTADDGSAEDDPLPRIDRIVLYIDDLDRCPPQRVVEVLAAVHLILALPLFVVVLAVDPRWLLQSLRLHYSALLAAEAVDGELPTEADDWRSTPLHYVEKIIQVPFALRPMTPPSARTLVHGLLPVHDAGGGPPPPTRVTEAPVGEPPSAEPVPGRRRSRPDGGLEPAAPAPSLTPRTLGLTAAERDFAADIAAELHTPRTIKKFTNLYRLLRARLDEHGGELDRFLDEDGDDVPEYQAVLILVTMVIDYPEQASPVLSGLLDAGGAKEWREHARAVRYGGGEECRDLARFLEWSTVRARNGPTSSREPFERWALEVSRYSFETGLEVFARRRR